MKKLNVNTVILDGQNKPYKVGDEELTVKRVLFNCFAAHVSDRDKTVDSYKTARTKVLGKKIIACEQDPLVLEDAEFESIKEVHKHNKLGYVDFVNADIGLAFMEAEKVES